MLNYSKSFTVLASAFAFASSIALANEGAIPSCYVANKLDMKLAPPPKKDILVLIDQTTVLDNSLKSSVYKAAGDQLQSGSNFIIARFSAFSQNKYAEVLARGSFESSMAESVRNDISVKLLKNFDNCLTSQLNFGRTLAKNALDTAFAGVTSDLAKSDVISSVKDFSLLAKNSKSNTKIVIVVSDMLENSSITSFYSKQTVRLIDPQKELKRVAESQLFGDFGGAKIYVIGAGVLAEDAKQPKGVYRDPKTMAALQQFWRAYFEKSNGKLIEFGQPALLNPIQ